MILRGRTFFPANFSAITERDHVVADPLTESHALRGTMRPRTCYFATHDFGVDGLGSVDGSRRIVWVPLGSGHRADGSGIARRLFAGPNFDHVLSHLDRNVTIALRDPIFCQEIDASDLIGDGKATIGAQPSKLGRPEVPLTIALLALLTRYLTRPLARAAASDESRELIAAEHGISACVAAIFADVDRQDLRDQVHFIDLASVKPSEKILDLPMMAFALLLTTCAVRIEAHHRIMAARFGQFRCRNHALALTFLDQTVREEKAPTMAYDSTVLALRTSAITV